ncbi:hypothetical protein [Arthrobacter sp. MDT1-65]
MVISPLKDSNDCLAYYLVVLAVLELELLFGTTLKKKPPEHEARLVIVAQLRRVGQPEIATGHINALLPLQLGCLIGDAVHRLNTNQSHSHIGIPELSGCGTE